MLPIALRNSSIRSNFSGFEALMGYLYLSGQYERMMELVKAGLESLELK